MENPSQPGDGKEDLEGILISARKALKRGDGWTIEPKHYDRLRVDCEKLGITGGESVILPAIKRGLDEITKDQIKRRSDPSYAGLADGETLYECKWDSVSLGRRMYFKFALSEGLIELFTFHESTER